MKNCSKHYIYLSCNLTDFELAGLSFDEQGEGWGWDGVLGGGGEGINEPTS